MPAQPGPLGVGRIGVAGRAVPFGLVLAAVLAGVLAWQVLTLDRHDRPATPCERFKANHWVGLALTLALLVEAWSISLQCRSDIPDHRKVSQGAHLQMAPPALASGESAG